MSEMTNDSPLGRLLEELSWEGNARKYREGGRGLENVLVTEEFSALDLLPRRAFLGEVLAAAHGADAARAAIIESIEDAVVDLLPGGPDLAAPGGPNIQPDAYLHLPDATVLVEAKRIRSGGFQLEQLAREFLSLMRDQQTADRSLLLVLPKPPAVSVRGLGPLEVAEAITTQLPAVHARAATPPPLGELMRRVADGWAYVTWSEIEAVTERQSAALHSFDDPFSPGCGYPHGVLRQPGHQMAHLIVNAGLPRGGFEKGRVRAVP